MEERVGGEVLIHLVAGARPNFVKIASLVRAIDRAREAGSSLRFRLVHTGQHYDHAMSGSFFAQLGLPMPDVNLKVGSGSQAVQTAAIMQGYEELLLRERPYLCVVVGDVNSTLACAIVAQKAGVPVAHVEGGLRSGDWSMPEEVNRLVTDAITNVYFTTTASAKANLVREGVPPTCIFVVGNTMIDTLLANRARLQRPGVCDSQRLTRRAYVVLTLHRPSNVDERESLRQVLEAACEGAAGMPVVFPVHPRTMRVLDVISQRPANLVIVDAMPYLEFVYLLDNAIAVITDSGGITEEATMLGIPCLTLRDTTERPETVEIGTNELLGTNPSAIAPAMTRVVNGMWKKGNVPQFWDGSAGDRIVAVLERLIRDGLPVRAERSDARR